MASEYVGKVSTRALAEKYGVDPKTVAEHLRSRGLQLGRLPMAAADIRRARELYSRGNSLNAIGRMIGRDPKTVKEIRAAGSTKSDLSAITGKDKAPESLSGLRDAAVHGAVLIRQLLAVARSATRQATQQAPRERTRKARLHPYQTRARLASQVAPRSSFRLNRLVSGEAPPPTCKEGEGS
jgi:hypothetical protein